MTKNMLTYLSHQFCINCCGDSKKGDCDARNVTCDKLVSFLVGCRKFQEPINDKELDELAKDFAYKEVSSYYEAVFHKPLPTNRENFGFISCEKAYKAGYRKAEKV